MDRLSTYIIFCDDVREEIGHKKSFVGVYSEELYVPTIPALIPKFYMVATISCRVEDIPKQLTIEFKLADEVMVRKEIASDILNEWKNDSSREISDEGAGEPPEQQPRARIAMEFLVSPFMVRKEGRIIAFVECEHGRARVGSLKIVKKEGEPTSAVDFMRKPSKS